MLNWMLVIRWFDVWVLFCVLVLGYVLVVIFNFWGGVFDLVLFVLGMRLFLGLFEVFVAWLLECFVYGFY